MRVSPQAQGPGGPPQTQAAPQQAQQQQGPSPQDAIQMIEQGFMALGKMIQAAGGQLPPEDVKLFSAAAQATDAMIQSLTGAGGQGGPDQDQGKPEPGGPMPSNANAKSQPSGPQG